MTEREQEVMALFEAGIPARRVAEDTGLSLAYVKQIRGDYDFDRIGQQDRRRDAIVRKATMALEAAILATGKRHS